MALIPAWNEAPRIGPVIEAARRHVPVLVVDDGSTDATAAVAEAAGAAVVRHAQNRRKGAALQTGFDWALERGYDAVVTLDADGQHDPAEIPKLVGAFESGEGDLIVGNRNYTEMAWPRPVTTRFGSWLLSRAMGAAVGDNQSGFRLLSRRLLEQMELTSGGFEMEVEIIWEAVRLGLSVAWVPIRTIYGIDKASYFHPFRDTVRFLKMVWRIWRRRKTSG
ncbi:MAG: glycosyltransferase family 2 protein [Anaerolineae bacterium]|nr:glycosyltransferase family 2 protein [Anaerolineae bacterium]